MTITEASSAVIHATEKSLSVHHTNGTNGTNGRVGQMAVVPLIDVQMRPIEWLWPFYLAFAKLVVVDGYPGQGKSTFSLDIAARGSRGLPMPDGIGGGLHFDTLVITFEDDIGDTLRPRLEAAGGDPRRVHHVAGVAYNGDEFLLPPSLPQDLALLEQVLLDRPEIRLVIIDPLTAALGNDVDSHRDQDVRRVLARLARIAADKGVCIIAIRHVRKNHGANAIAAGGGSIGIIGQARTGLLIDRHPDDPAAAVLAMTKNNLGPIAPSLTFRKVSVTLPLANGESLTTSRLDWTGIAELSADELLASRGESTARSARDAQIWLRNALHLGPKSAGDLFQAAVADGIARRTLQRAADSLKVVKDRKGFGAGSRWYLPTSIHAINANTFVDNDTDINGANIPCAVELSLSSKADEMAPQVPVL